MQYFTILFCFLLSEGFNNNLWVVFISMIQSVQQYEKQKLIKWLISFDFRNGPL